MSIAGTVAQSRDKFKLVLSNKFNIMTYKIM